MAQRTTELEPETEIRRLMDELHVDWDAAALVYALEQGYGLEDDRISLAEGESLEDALEAMRQRSKSPVTDGAQ
jgi:hypothetical protein